MAKKPPIIPDQVFRPDADKNVNFPLPENAIQQGIAKGGDGKRVGVFGSSESNTGVYARSIAQIGLVAEGKSLAAQFRGDVEVTGDIRLTNADCAEEFDVADTALAEPGTVMVIGEEGVITASV